MEEKNQLYDANDLLSTLIYMKKQFGIDVFHDAKKMNSILGDLSPTLKRDGKILQRLLSAGLFQELEETDFTNEIEKLRARGRVKNWLIDEEFIQEERAVYYSQVVCAVYGGDFETTIFVEENKESYRETFEKNISNNAEEVKENKIVINKSPDFIIEDGVLKKYVGNDEVVIVPEGVSEIGVEAFSGCKHIKSVTMPNSVIHIREFAFACCSSLIEIIFSEWVTKIGDYAFNGCSSIKSIELPEWLREISEGCFAVCKNLECITVPERVEKIGARAFQSCISLKNIRLPRRMNEIEEACFNHCDALERIVFPQEIRKIAKSAFANCKSLKNVELPNSLEKIDSHAFARCNNLEKVIVSVATKIEFTAFPSGVEIVKYIQIGDEIGYL